MEKNTYRIFVASTLRMKEARQAVEEVAKQINEELESEGIPVEYKCYLYEQSEYSQKLEDKDAQAPIDKELCNSEIFFLLMEDNLGALTEHEFDLALKQHDKGSLPHFIFVFRNNGQAEAPEVEGISYEKLITKYNLADYRYDNEHKPVTHYRVYDIPFDSSDSLKEMIMEQLEKLSSNGELPPHGAKRGRMLEKSDFFADDQYRLDNCPNVYYPRRNDIQLLEMLQSQNIVVVVGPSLSGKTRMVMEALKQVDDGWVCQLGKDGNRVEDLNALTSYMNSNKGEKLYIVVDNLDTLTDDEGVRKALQEMIGELQKQDNKSVLVGTASSSDDINLNGIEDVNILRMENMKDKDFDDIKLFFLSFSCGVTVDERNWHYRQIGALFVKPDDIWNEHYVGFLEAGDVPEEELRIQVTFLRQSMLMSLKAQSIWRNDHLGDVSLLKSMTSFFYKQNYKHTINDSDIISEIFDDSLELLCAGGRMGCVLRADGSCVAVQEYVYRYLIGYDGQRQKESNTSFDAEKKLIKKLIAFCKGCEEDEPLFNHVSRLIRRCDHKKKVCQWLYGLLLGTEKIEKVEEEDRTLAELLCGDRESREALAESDDRLRHFYSVIPRQYIYYCCSDTKRALEVYRQCPEGLRTADLLAAVLRSAKTTEEMDEVRALDDYKGRFGSTPYILRAEVEKATDYAAAKPFIDCLSEQAANQTFAEAEGGTRYNVLQLQGVMGVLGAKVSSMGEMDSYLDLLRQHYPLLVLEAKGGSTGDTKTEGLTDIDLLCTQNLYVVRKCVSGAVQGDLSMAHNLLKRILECVPSTLRDGGPTTETRLRLVVSAIGSVLIEAVKDSASYDEVLNYLYKPLDIEHPLKEGHRMLLRSTFTYTNMIRLKDCSVFDINNLFNNDLEPHANDPDNPLYVNRYMLNTMLKKSIANNRGKRDEYIDGINKLFDMLSVKRDTYTYSQLLRVVGTLEKCIALLEQMKGEKVPANIYILLALQSNPSVSLRQSLSFVADIYRPARCKLEVIASVKDIIAEQLKGMGDDKSLEYHKNAWTNIFRKSVLTDDDRGLLNQCLAHLEEKAPKLLEDGKLYNIAIGNGDNGDKSTDEGEPWLPSVDKAFDFINEHEAFRPDSYTAGALVMKIKKLRDKRKRKREALKRLNSFFRNNPSALNDLVIGQRLSIYKAIDEKLSMVFPNENGEMKEEKLLSPMGYVEKMHAMCKPVGSYIINDVCRCNTKGNKDVFRRLMEILVAEQEYYTFNSSDKQTIRERLGKYLDEKLRIEAVSPSQQAMIANKQAMTEFKREHLKVSVALERINWKNHNSAVVAFNDIVSVHIDRSIRSSIDRKPSSEIFNEVKRFYDKYFNKDCSPDSYTFPILAKAASTMNEFRKVLDAYEQKKKDNPLLSLQPHMLGEMSRLATTVDELKKETAAMIAAGCKPDQTTAEKYVTRLVHNLYKDDKDNTQPILNNLLKYVIEGGDKETMLVKDGRKNLLLDSFADPSKVTGTLLSELLYYNSQTCCYTDLATVIIEKYRTELVPLMNSLSQRGSNQLRWDYLPRFIVELMPYESPELPKNDLATYNKLLQACYEKNYTPSGVLVLRLNQALQSIGDDRAVQRTKAQVVVNAHQNRLCLGHFLVERADEKYKDWCQKGIKDPWVLEELSANYALASMDDKQQYYLSLLDDGYHRGLKAIFLDCRKKGKEAKQGLVAEGTVARKVMLEMEHDFSELTKNGEKPFKALKTLPWLWYNAAWTPSEEVVLAVVGRYAALADSEAEAKTYKEAIIERLKNALRQKLSVTCLFYNTLGIFNKGYDYNISVSTSELEKVLLHKQPRPCRQGSRQPLGAQTSPSANQ